MSQDIFEKLRIDEWRNYDYKLAADEIERLRYERREWFLVARQLRDALMMKREIDDALNDYLRTRGRLEDPRDCFEEANSE